MKYLAALLLLCTLCSGASAATAQKSIAPEPQPPTDACRFLFIVETSSSMRSLQEANRNALFDMIFTGLGGQMRTGDTFGLWTYNQETYAGQFPMQLWDAQNPMEVASRATLFLSGQKYSGEAHIETLAGKIRGVTRAVGDVTIFILSDGSVKFSEIPYSEAINTEYQQRAKERSRAKKPFITALIARGGKVVAAYVALAGQPLPLPDRAAPAVAAKKAPAATVPVTPNLPLAAVVPSAPPLVASAPEISVTPAPEVRRAVVTPDSPAGSPTPDVVVTPTAAPEPALTPVPTPAAPRKKVFQIITRSNAPAPPAESVLAETIVAATNPPPAPFAETNLVSVIAKAEPPVASEPPMAPVAPVAPVPPVPQPIPTTLAASFPDALPVAAREFEGSTPTPTPMPPSLTAAVPLSQGLSAGAQLLIGGSLLVSAVFLIVVVLRRVRPVPQPSLITRSMERR